MKCLHFDLSDHDNFFNVARAGKSCENLKPQITALLTCKPQVLSGGKPACVPCRGRLACSELGGAEGRGAAGEASVRRCPGNVQSPGVQESSPRPGAGGGAGTKALLLAGSLANSSILHIYVLFHWSRFPLSLPYTSRDRSWRSLRPCLFPMRPSGVCVPHPVSQCEVCASLSRAYRAERTWTSSGMDCFRVLRAACWRARWPAVLAAALAAPVRRSAGGSAQQSP